MKNRGLYGQSEGNEHRLSSQQFNERMADNELVEGSHVAILRARFEEQDWTRFNSYIEHLKKINFSRSRIDSMVVRASSGVRI